MVLSTLINFLFQIQRQFSEAVWGNTYIIVDLWYNTSSRTTVRALDDTSCLWHDLSPFDTRHRDTTGTFMSPHPCRDGPAVTLSVVTSIHLECY